MEHGCSSSDSDEEIYEEEVIGGELVLVPRSTREVRPARFSPEYRNGFENHCGLFGNWLKWFTNRLKVAVW